MKRFIWLAVATLLFAFQIGVGSVAAVELDATIRTVALNDNGDTTVVKVEQYEQGKRLFVDTCSQCHVGGRTKTNPNVQLGPDDLAGAYPRRDSIAGLVDYMKNPTTYDGEIEISELHPSTKSADIFPEMRNLTQNDLEAIAAYILIEPKVKGIMWGTGKVYN